MTNKVSLKIQHWGGGG